MTVRHIKVIGRVQGIGYRRWAQHEAVKFNLSGWVRNVSDGSVELMVDGEEHQVNLFLKSCSKGPVFAFVLGIQPVTIPYATPAPIEPGEFRIIASV